MGASWLIYIPLAWVMPIMWGWGISGFWWSDFFGEAFKVVVLFWGVSKVNWNVAAREARERAEAHGEDLVENEKLEVAAYSSPAGYVSPAARTGIASPMCQSPGLMTANAAQNFESRMGGTFIRSPVAQIEEKLEF